MKPFFLKPATCFPDSQLLLRILPVSFSGEQRKEGNTMDNVATSRRNHTHKKGNKENTNPTHGSKSFIRGDKASVVPFRLKGNKKAESTTNKDSLKATSKGVDSKPVSGDAQKKVKTVQRDGKGAAAAEVKQPTHNQLSSSDQAEKLQKADASIAPAAAPSSKSAPGMYKGRIVQSKIGSLWKSTDTLTKADPKPSAPKSESQRVGNANTKSRSLSVNGVSRQTTKNPALRRSKSASDKPAPVTKSSSSNPHPAGFCSNRPPTRTVPATLTSARSRNATLASVKSTGNQKPKVPVTDKKVNKPAATSSLSQYRFTMETVEERRARLAEWLASKGKTLKRPAMTTAAPSINKGPAKARAEVQSGVEPWIAAERKPEAELHTETLQSEVPVQHPEETPGIMNTTLDLLDNSDDDPQDRVDDIVVNLCDALEAMVTPSRCCEDEVSQVKDECDVEEKCIKPDDECKKEVRSETVKMEQTDEVPEEEDEEVESDDDVIETTPETSDASVIKYSVKTTPYLQSVKKTIEDEVSTSRKKSNIKDLKFLTPVRRSSRIQRKSSRLPAMLVDHDPCVSSLAELVRLDDDPNAYIYRKNPALLQELPDQSKV